VEAEALVPGDAAHRGESMYWYTLENFLFARGEPVMRRFLICLLLAASVPSPAFACLWDSDTLVAERSRFPTTLEIITGKFLRHSPEFYAWRISDREKKLRDSPSNLAFYDDLAVAHDKAGDQDKAIETILAKDMIQPGLYETEANLGTFLIHAGKYDEGLAHIRRAIEINPDAHFGREKYQVLLVEYLLPRLRDGKPSLPLSKVELDGLGHEGEPGGQTFAEFLQAKNDGELSRAEQQAAIKGVLGIMRFSKHDSPVVLEALGSLLAHGIPGAKDAKQLAARAFLQASYQTNDDEVKSAYREMAEDSLEMQVNSTLDKVEEQFTGELADANTWYAALRQRELQWIENGDDVDAKFAELYKREPRLSMLGGYTLLDGWMWGGIVAAGLALAIFVYRRIVSARLRRRSNSLGEMAA
jgi:tetratricopeptide (TPR) repeat protein